MYGTLNYLVASQSSLTLAKEIFRAAFFAEVGDTYARQGRALLAKQYFDRSSMLMNAISSATRPAGGNTKILN
jgi:hypothetical protein